MAKAVKPNRGCGYVVFVILLLVGGGLLAVALAEGRTVRQPGASVVVPAVFGLMFLGAAFAYLGFARREVAKHAASAKLAAENPDKPWLLKPEWQGGAIESTSGRGTLVLWFFAMVWNAISFVAAWAVLTKEQEAKSAYFVLLFPLVGILVLWAAIHQTIKWRKFGRVRFVPSSLPGAIGGYLGGVIEVPARLVLEADARVSLRCVRRVTQGSGKNRSTSESVLWEREELVARDQWMGAANRTDIPVLFYIPPECEPWDDEDPDNEVVWRLRAEAAVPGVDFSTSFEVPVFRTGETAAPPEPGRPLLAEYRAGPADAETLRRAGVQVLADGFGFDAAHLGTGRFVTSAVALALFALFAVLLVNGAHFAVLGVTGFLSGLAGLFAGDLWSARFEVRILGTDVVVTQFRPWGAKVTRLPRAEVAAVRTRMSMSAGETRYYRLTLIGRNGVEAATAAAGEHFDARKLRFRLKRLAKELGVQDPAKLGERGNEIFEEMARTPRFEVVIAKHIPGQATAESVGESVMEQIRTRRPGN